MWVAKFGGSCLRSAQDFKSCAALVRDKKEVGLVVVSATYQTTRQLEAVFSLAQEGLLNKALDLFDECSARHRQLGEQLAFGVGELKELDAISKEARGLISSPSLDGLLATGEYWSSLLFYWALLSVLKDRQVELMDACHLIKTDSQFGAANPVVRAIDLCCKRELIPALKRSLVVTQGFIGSNERGQSTTLGKEGSDYSATLLAYALKARGVQIWTDVAGLFSADPKLVSSPRVLRQLNHKEAYWMAQMGAQVLFPKSLHPAYELKIPIFVGNPHQLSEGGSLISDRPDSGIKSLCLKRDKDISLSIVGRGAEKIAVKLPLVSAGEYHRSFIIKEGEGKEELRYLHRELFEIGSATLAP